MVMEKIDSNLIPIKPSHIKLYNNFPLYYLSERGEAVLYKKAEDPVDEESLKGEKSSELFILREDEAVVVKKILSALNRKLVEDISQKGLTTIKQSICRIVEEAIEGPHELSLNALPETLEILFSNSKKSPKLIEALTTIHTNSRKVIEHSVNVLALTTQYCFFKGFSDDEIKRFGLCALLHDVGTSHIDQGIVESDEKLSDTDFKTLKTHTVKGYNDLKSVAEFHDSVGVTALQHHELLDGTGYPKGVTQISFEAQVIGIIDSYEPLKYSSKNFRKSLKPYDALNVIKADVLEGKYNRQVFVDLCACLTK